jgi:phosphatidylglycerophosphate synthase
MCILKLLSFTAMKHIPIGLIYLRIFIGVTLLILSLLHVPHYNIIAVVLFSAGLLSDIFDGIIARHLNISSEKLRRMDSSADQVFFILTVAATFITCPDFFYNHYIMLTVLFGTELLTYVLCFIKFRKEVATHAILSKLWTLVMFATLIQIMTTCSSGLLFNICFYVGMISRFEIIGILLLLRQWTNDVPSLYHAVLLRQGKPIKRHKLFNG